jgi:hypothetical protein
MDKELLAQILPIVEKTKEGILKGVEVAQEQMPELIEQIIRWHFVRSLMVFIVGLIFAIGIPIACYWTNKEHNLDGVPYIGLILMFVPFMIWDLANGFVWLQILIAPKLFLIEYISSLLK